MVKRKWNGSVKLLSSERDPKRVTRNDGCASADEVEKI